MMLARLLSKIYKKGGVILIDAKGQKYICGQPDLKKPITVRLLKKNLNWKLVLNPDLNFPEAYMRNEIQIENATLLEFLYMFFENIGPSEINYSGYAIKKLLHFWRFLTNYNLPGRSKKMLNIIMILVKSFMIFFWTKNIGSILAPILQKKTKA